ncbi:MAG: 3-oxoacyl-ACP synthase [Bacteroidota bacterium]
MLKQKLHQSCLDLLEEKIGNLQKAVQDAQMAASEDTKSSAGDKFETSREMIKLEINKYNQQLSQNTKMLHHLQKLNPAIDRDRVEMGSLVLTNEGAYYFSVGMGKLILGETPYFALSMASPIGRALAGHQKGEHISFKGRSIHIQEIL